MISSISGLSQMQRPAPPQSQPMTDEEKETAGNILSKYDPSNMTQTEMESMREEFEEAGIKPSEDLKSMMEEAGFKAPEGPGPKGGKGIVKPPEFSKLMEKLESSDISEEEIQSFIENLQNEKGGFSGTIMDEFV